MAEPLRILSRVPRGTRYFSPSTHRRTAASDAPIGWAQERKRLLEMLRHQQRVAQSGLMTAALAHDVNNHIQGVSGRSYVALLSDDPTDWKEALERIQQHCRDLSETTSAFMSFVRRRTESTRTEFRAGEAIEQAHRLLQTLAKRHGVTLATALDDAPPVEGQRRLAIQALINLGSNAIRACAPSRGTVVLAARAPNADTCRLEVQDDGPGIPEHLRQQLFRPFETGHAQDGGNGIGLFVVDQCVRGLGGTVRVNTSTSGTIFRLDLPAASNR